MSHLITPLLAAALSQIGPADVAALPAPVAATARPEQDDANLHALHVAGGAAWVCGDRGVIWHSADAGRSWRFQPTSTGLSLRSLSFLTNQIGWAAGGGTAAFTADSVGVVLKTEDGGTTWERIDTTPLPSVVAVRFFTPDTGLAACKPTDLAPSGLWTTADGGRTWTPLPGPRLGHWRAAALTGPERGLLVGERGRIALAGGGSLVASPTAPGGLPALCAVTATGPVAFACGDGGRVWTTSTAGRAWEPVAGPLPTNLVPNGLSADDLDLRGVWAKGDDLAVCGDPGGVVFVRALDESGQPRWTAGSAGGTAPLNAVAFAQSTGEPYGLAVGDFGTIVRTSAAPGQAAAVGWSTVRGRERRAATLAIVADPADAPFLALTHTAGDDGHRSVVLCPVRRDLGAAAIHAAGEANRLDSAVLTAGGSAGLIGWDFPLTVPGSEDDPAALAREWNARFEGENGAGGAADRLVRRLARAIRTWRPSVVILPPSDPAANPTGPDVLIRRATEQAIALAADPTRLTGLDRLGLRPWRVTRALERRPAGEPSTVTVRAADTLRTLGGTTGDLASSALSRVSDAASPAVEGFRPLGLPALSSKPHGADRVMAGVRLVAGGDARRAGRPRIAEPDPDVVLRRRLLTAAADRLVVGANGAGAASQLLRPEAITANLRPLSAGVPPAQAAADLARLARQLSDAQEIDAAEAVLLELASRFPDQPATHAVLPDLMRLWCGSEQSSRRLAPIGVRTENRDEQNVIQTADGGARAGASRVETADVNVDRGGVGQRDALRKRRLQGVIGLGAQLERYAPRQFATRDVQRSMAAARRQLGLPTPPDSPATAILAGDASDAALPCAFAASTPRLDGEFADACWRAAEAVPLTSAAGRSRGGLVMAARDDRFLFLAASLPIEPGAPLPAVNMSGRGHDEPTRPHDRLELALDVDRDFGTAWNLTIAADGAVAEDCCGDPTWDPRCAVHVSRQPGASADDPGEWRIELAIPLSELTAEIASKGGPPIGSAWGLRMRRVTPGVGAASWPVTATDAVGVTDDAVRPFGALRWTK
ncbi:hypothetical protein [Alienimonas chondri]|uniref:Photosynthesis system II assembly factor Ycf48/Hcf136-like domain-containing protein n=1 Tax=Alienimonas chondri TaxID=2681879 RepID=A0ABX1VJ68_9PLAN|nr:hypothetical protein [Alienimonas chondri]NNJ27900.1 hypothetical protein [Alienimonas chondri]